MNLFIDRLAPGGGGAEPESGGGSVVQSAYDAMPGQILDFFVSHPMIVVMILLAVAVSGAVSKR